MLFGILVNQAKRVLTRIKIFFYPNTGDQKSTFSLTCAQMSKHSISILKKLLQEHNHGKSYSKCLKTHEGVSRLQEVTVLFSCLSKKTGSLIKDFSYMQDRGNDK